MHKKTLNQGIFKKFAKNLSQFMAAVLLIGSLSVGGTVNAAVVNDLDKSSDYAKEAIQSLANSGVISGDTKGNFNPRKAISRAELVTLLVKALEIDGNNLPEAATFSDVPTSHWAFGYVETAYQTGLISGIGNGKFGVNDPCTREQITMMLLNYFSVSKEAVLADYGLEGLEKFQDETAMSDWAKAAIQFAVSNNLMSGTRADMFSPKGSATKEQIAVILYKLLGSIDSIQQAADDLRKPIITYNGDVLTLKVQPEVENGEVLVPLEAFNIIGAKVTVDASMDHITIENAVESDRNIYLKVGSTEAYIDYTGTGSPYDDPTAEEERIELAAAPKKVENEVLVPVKAAAEAVGLKVALNAKTNLVTIDDNSGVKNPILYRALQNTLQYKGEYSIGMVMDMVEKISGEKFGMTYTMDGAVNGKNSTAKSKITIEFSEFSGVFLEEETVKIGDKVYLKDVETGEWSVLSLEEAEELGTIYYDNETEQTETQQLLDDYKNVNVIYLGKAVVNGEELSRYKVNVGSDLLEQLIAEGLYESDTSIDDINNMQFSYEMFVNGKGQLVKQQINVTGDIIDQEGYSLDFKLNMFNEFSNIGKDIQIVSPL